MHDLVRNPIPIHIAESEEVIIMVKYESKRISVIIVIAVYILLVAGCPDPNPTGVPTAIPTAIPTGIPTATPTAAPTGIPTATPTAAPTGIPTATPTAAPTSIPTVTPTAAPTSIPTATPTAAPTTIPTAVPTATPNTPVLSGPASSTGPFTVNWTFTWPGIGSADDHYELESSYSQTSGYSIFVSTPNNVRTSPYSTSVYPEAIDIGKTLYFRVRARSGGSYTPYSNVISVSIPSLSLIITPNYDNLIMMSSADSTLANNVYSTGSNAVGTNYMYGAYVNDYLIGATVLRYDINNYINGRTIQTAVLRVRPINIPADFNTTYAVQPIASAWSASVTWNTAPSIYTSATYKKTFNPPVSTSIDIEIDVTSIVQGWASGAISNFGLFVQDNNIAWPGATAYRAFDFNSVETNITYCPRLYVEVR